MPPPSEPGTLDLVWECGICGIQQLEYNVPPNYAGIQPSGWKHDEMHGRVEKPGDDLLCSKCHKMFEDV